jgi:hypothetical protein
MYKSWLKTIACVAACSMLSSAALAANISDEEMQSIQQYCDEMNGFGSFASEEERMQAVTNCIDDEVKRASQYEQSEGSGDMDKPE